MDAQLNQIFFPESLNELFSAWNRFPQAVPYAGGTDLIWRLGKNNLTLPPQILCLDKLTELHRITRTEHYIEIGSMVKLNKLIWLGKIVPEVLCQSIEQIGGVQLRNQATVGGNICCTSSLLDIPAVLTALDAQYEFRNAHNTRWVSASRFHSVEERDSFKNQELLTRVRLPLVQWDYSIYKKFFPEDIYNSKTLVFLAKTQKNMLSDIRVIYKEKIILRNKTAESILTGKNLPITRKTAGDFVQNWKEFLLNIKEIDDFSKHELVNSIEENVYNLTE